MTAFPALARRPDLRWNSPGVAIFRAWLNSLVENRRANRPVQPVAAPALADEAA
jgi:hypothetical protein